MHVVENLNYTDLDLVVPTKVKFMTLNILKILTELLTLVYSITHCGHFGSYGLHLQAILNHTAVMYAYKPIPDPRLCFPVQSICKIILIEV